MSVIASSDSFENNEVVIDYKEQKVLFKVVGARSLLGVWFMFLVNLFGFALLRIFLLFFLLMMGVACIAFFDFNNAALAEFLTVAMVVALVAVLLWVVGYSLLFFRKRWRSVAYPQCNYLFQRWSGEEKFLTVNPAAVIDRKFLLPCFSNIGVEYQASKDFAFFLERVEVRSLYTTDEGEWLCCFSFREQPLEGELRLRYI